MEIFNITVIDLMINVVLAVIMFGLGISLTINDSLMDTVIHIFIITILSAITGLYLKRIYLLPYAIVFNLLSFVFSIGFGRLTKINMRDNLTNALEVSLQNTTLALLIGGTMLQDQELIKPALIYAMFSIWISVILGILTISLYKKKLEFKF